MKKKNGIIITSITLLLLLVVGVTYAFFTYESGTKSDIVTGQIYMNYEETSTISLTGVFPETKAQALARQDENGVFEFTITGRNTSKYPVYYEIDLLEGGVITGATAQSTRILPEHVRIYLERDGVPVIEGKTYADWNNRRIYVDAVPANQTSNIEHKYTLRMWIDENVTISDTNPDADYTTSEWNDAYTSLKVRVVGDFEYKEIATDASCFEYRKVAPDGYVAYNYPIVTLDTSEEKVEACMSNMMRNFGGTDMSTAQDGYQSFCEGNGTMENPSFGTADLKKFVMFALNNGGTSGQVISMLPVVASITNETRYYELNTSKENVNACKEYILNFFGDDYSDAQDGYQTYCEGTGTADGYTIIDDLNRGMPAMDYFIANSILTQVETLQGEIEITNYDGTCGMEVIIPSQIEGLPVTRIAEGGMASYGGFNSFYRIGIASVKLPDTLKYIGYQAFANNNLTQIVIPDNVTAIYSYAFSNNYLNNITLGKSVSDIGTSAFNIGTRNNNNPIERIVNKSGNAFDWSSILGVVVVDRVQDPGIVETGTYIYKHNTDGNKEVLITSE